MIGIRFLRVRLRITAWVKGPIRSKQKRPRSEPGRACAGPDRWSEPIFEEEHRVADRAQFDDENAFYVLPVNIHNGKLKVEIGKSIHHFPLSVFDYSFLHCCFLDKHDGNLIADRVNKGAFRVNAFQTRLSVVNPYFGFALRASQNF